jgi:hypothetical protein
MYEKRTEPVIPFGSFVFRLLRSVLLAGSIVVLALAAGMAGYHFTENMPWIDALLNASMILGGMGPVDSLHTMGGKLFASAYALFSGLVLVSTAGILLTPVLHRLLHRFHAD